MVKIYGKPAHGSEVAIYDELSTLPDDYHVFCNVYLMLSNSVKNHDKYVRSAQMDFIVIGSTGVYVIEVKDWSKEYVKSLLPHKITPYEQVERAGLVLYILLKGCDLEKNLTVNNLLVSVNFKFEYLNKFPYVHTLDKKELINHIKKSKKRLSSSDIEYVKKYVQKIRLSKSESDLKKYNRSLTVYENDKMVFHRKSSNTEYYETFSKKTK